MEVVKERCRGLDGGRAAVLFGQSGRFAHLGGFHLSTLMRVPYPTIFMTLLNIALSSTTARADPLSLY
jgi:hypothetical protein